jgi:hypothetical protein
VRALPAALPGELQCAVRKRTREASEGRHVDLSGPASVAQISKVM